MNISVFSILSQKNKFQFTDIEASDLMRLMEIASGSFQYIKEYDKLGQLLK